MPQLNLTLDYKTMDQITVANLKETYDMILKYEHFDENDDCMLRSIENVMEYYMSPSELKEWRKSYA